MKLKVQEYGEGHGVIRAEATKMAFGWSVYIVMQHKYYNYMEGATISSDLPMGKAEDISIISDIDDDEQFTFTCPMEDFHSEVSMVPETKEEAEELYMKLVQVEKDSIQIFFIKEEQLDDYDKDADLIYNGLLAEQPKRDKK